MPKYRSRVGSKSRTLKAKRNKTVKDFKSIDNYLDSVYRNNKEYLDKYIDRLGDSRTKREIFKKAVKDYMKLTNPETGKEYDPVCDKYFPFDYGKLFGLGGLM